MVHSILGEAGFSGVTLFATHILPMFKLLKRHTLELPLFKLFTWTTKYVISYSTCFKPACFVASIIVIDEWIYYSRQFI